MIRILMTVVALILLSSCADSGAPATAESPSAESKAPAPPAGRNPAAPDNTATPAITLTIPDQPLATDRPSAPATGREEQGLEYARGLTERFYRGEIPELYALFSDGLKEVLTLDQMHQLHRHVVETYGKETLIIGEDSKSSNEYRAFVRWARFDKTKEVIEIRWTLKPDNSIAEFWIRPAERTVKTEAN